MWVNIGLSRKINKIRSSPFLVPYTGIEVPETGVLFSLWLVYANFNRVMRINDTLMAG